MPNTKISGLDRMRMVRDQRENELLWPAESRRIAAENRAQSLQWQLMAVQDLLRKVEQFMSTELMKRLADHIAHEMAKPILRAVYEACMSVKDRREMVTVRFPMEDVIMQDDNGKVRRVLDRWLSERRAEVNFSLADLGPSDEEAVEVVRTRVSLPSINFNHDELVKPKRRSVA